MSVKGEKNEEYVLHTPYSIGYMTNGKTYVNVLIWLVVLRMDMLISYSIRCAYIHIW